jgi:hypothetical protein
MSRKEIRPTRFAGKVISSILVNSGGPTPTQGFVDIAFEDASELRITFTVTHYVEAEYVDCSGERSSLVQKRTTLGLDSCFEDPAEVTPVPSKKSRKKNWRARSFVPLDELV